MRTTCQHGAGDEATSKLDGPLDAVHLHHNGMDPGWPPGDAAYTTAHRFVALGATAGLAA
jgi:hypothetical protein